jgi:putative ABC transport system ATP-binding protein
MIVLKGASKIYTMGGEEIRAIDSIDLKIENGEFVALVGPSGSGKSTLMNVIGALDSLEKGKIIVEGTDISKMRDKGQAEYRRKRVGFIFQTFNLQRRLTALENVELPLMFDAIGAKKREEMARKALGKVKLTDRVKHRPTELSGGQQQRVAIARAIVNNPDILLADEPTGNLDSKSGEETMKLIKDLNKSDGVTVVMVTHNDEHAGFADRVLYMRDGKISYQRKGKK